MDINPSMLEIRMHFDMRELNVKISFFLLLAIKHTSQCVSYSTSDFMLEEQFNSYLLFPKTTQIVTSRKIFVIIRVQIHGLRAYTEEDLKKLIMNKTAFICSLKE